MTEKIIFEGVFDIVEIDNNIKWNYRLEIDGLDVAENMWAMFENVMIKDKPKRACLVLEFFYD